ncbi:MAG: creatininase family protein [Alphaproteobacteria bacterium]|nr:creatininase family protein [Alphaproteobacteria bacterium]
MSRRVLLAAIFAVMAVLALALKPSDTVTGPPKPYQPASPIATGDLPLHLEALTWTEVGALVRAGKTVAIVPTGGTEQNGPHMVLGKHNYVVRHTAARVAARLGNALVTPVVTYVPEGRIDPPEGHMAYAGTISIPPGVFAATLEAAARSLRAHGFTTICFLGDSGGNQSTQARVAAKLNAEWADSGAQVIHVSDYYSGNGQTDWLLADGETRSSIGSHAGIRDTSELLAVFPDGVRFDRRRPSTAPGMANSGVIGDPTRASAARGREMLRLKVEAAVRQIQDHLEPGS